MIRPTDESINDDSEAFLRQAMQASPPPLGDELLAILSRWYGISSVNQPGQANELRFPLLKWAVQGRAEDVLAWLDDSSEAEVKAVAEEIRRIADLPFPPRNEKAQRMALELWAWLKVELYGSTGGPAG